MSEFSEILSQFHIDTHVSGYGNGHINDTYLVESTPRYILQRINSRVFTKPEDVIENILLVTTHLRQKIIEKGGDPERETLTLIPAKNGAYYYKTPDGAYYRLYKFIDGAASYDAVEQPVWFYHAGRAFGAFQRMLADFPAHKLHETIAGFHNTARRVAQLEQAIAEDRMHRLKDVMPEVDFALSCKKEAPVITDAMQNGLVPLRVTHNDTKLNNVMLDHVTGKGVCVIDLDTVMPGSLLYDFGDALRFGASTGSEDEKDLEKIQFDETLFTQFASGFLEELYPVLTETEKSLLVFSAKLMTYECGIRFLADYLNGDLYFKTHYAEQNLDRARTQLKLVCDIGSKQQKLESIIEQILNKQGR